MTCEDCKRDNKNSKSYVITTECGNVIQWFCEIHKKGNEIKLDSYYDMNGNSPSINLSELKVRRFN